MSTRPGSFTLAAALVSAAWLGSVALFGAVVAPAAFDVLPSRALAGTLVGRVVPVLFVTGIFVGVLLAAAAWRRASGKRRSATMAAGALVVLACLLAQFVIGARIDRMRASAPAALDALPPGDPIRVTFGRLHGLSVAGLGLAAVSAGAALVLLLRTPAQDHPG